MIKRISKKVTHQGIGGKEFIIDEQITATLNNDEIMEKAFLQGNWACHNFIERRPDFKHDFPHKLYYVKVNGLGYIIAEDEIETEVEPSDIKLPEIPDGNGIGSGGGAAGAMAAVMPNLKQELKLEPININEELIKNINESINRNMMSGGMM